MIPRGSGLYIKANPISVGFLLVFFDMFNYFLMSWQLISRTYNRPSGILHYFRETHNVVILKHVRYCRPLAISPLGNYTYTGPW